MIGIIILNFNNSKQTLSCLDSLYALTVNAAYKVCVVDNASRKEEVEVLKSGLKRGETLIEAAENCGYARGNNLGAELFEKDPQVDKILILNDDCLFTEDVLTPMAAYIDSHPECGVVFPLVKAADGSIDMACMRKAKSNRDLFLQGGFLGRFPGLRNEFLPTTDIAESKEIHTEVPPGSCMMLSKTYFKSIGYLDPNTFLYFEEHILAAKLNHDGRSCVLLPQVSITHLGAGTTKKQSSRIIYNHWRNSYLYYLKNYSSMPGALQLWLRFRTRLKSFF